MGNRVIFPILCKRKFESGKYLRFVLSLSFFTMLLATAEAAETERYEGTRKLMGVQFKIVVYSDNETKAAEAIEAAFERVRQIETRISDYRPTSEINQLCATAPHSTWQEVSNDVWEITNKSIELSKTSGGAFDITVGPLTKIWRYYRSRKQLPDLELLNKARQSVGHTLVKLDQQQKKLRLTKPGMRLDFGGIGKGYAADKALDVLKSFGIKSALIDASGDIVASEAPPGKNAWTVKISKMKNQESSTTINLRHCAVATSGDAYQFLEVAGVRYSHIVNPRTGLGLTVQSQVTVIAATATDADSFASAVSVLGPKNGIKLVNSIDAVEAQVLFLEHPAGDLKTCRTNKFPVE